MAKVTVIMPSLNVAKYIRQCIESVLNQTLTDIKVIAIDAGSTDGTLEILNEYASIDKRVTVILSDRKSYGYQMNLGIKAADSEYIGIVETDDYIDSEMYQTLYKTACKYNADYCKANAVGFTETKDMVYESIISVFPEKNDITVISPTDVKDIVLRDRYIWKGIYKKELLYQIRLNESAGAAYQDIGFLVQVFTKAKKAVYLNNVFYHYRQDNPNASGYNRKAFSFLVEEYNYTDRFTSDQSQEFITALCCKMFRQTSYRMRLMALSGVIWDNAESQLSTLAQRFTDHVNVTNIASEYLNIDEMSDLHIFIESPMKLYEKYTIEENNRLKTVISFFDTIKKFDNVIIFGCGRLGRFLSAVISLNGIDNLIAFCDNNSEQWGKTVLGKKVISPSDAVTTNKGGLFIVANTYHSFEIKEQLLKADIAPSSIIEYDLGINSLLLNSHYIEKD